MRPYPEREGYPRQAGSTFLRPPKRPALSLFEEEGDSTSPPQPQSSSSRPRQTARISVRAPTFRNLLPPPPQYCIHGNCFECLAQRVKLLPKQACLAIVRAISNTGVNTFHADGTVVIDGTKFFKELCYNDFLQLQFVRRLGVVSKVGIITHDFYTGLDGHVRCGYKMNGGQIMTLCRHMGTKHRPEYAHEEA